MRVGWETPPEVRSPNTSNVGNPFARESFVSGTSLTTNDVTRDNEEAKPTTNAAANETGGGAAGKHRTAREA